MENINFSLNEITKENRIIDLEQDQRALHVDYFLPDLPAYTLPAGDYTLPAGDYTLPAGDYTLPAGYNYSMYYDKSFSSKELTKILQYYGIQKGKMVKDEMLQILLLFETEPINKLIVERRMRLWHNIQELKTDPYFSKYILF
jgi:hypothetical protein